MEGVQGVLMQAIAIMALDKVDNGQHEANHGQAAKDALVGHNLERLYVQVRHEVVLKRDLSCLHTLHRAPV